MEPIRITKRDAVRAMFAGARAVSLRPIAQRLYELGGRTLLPAAAQQAVRGALEHEATRMLAGAGMLFEGASAAKALGAGATEASGALAATTATTIAATTARAAGQQMLRGIGRAAGIGALIDGAWGAAEATYRYKKGTMTGREACVHVAKEAGTGAAATAAGAAAAALVVTMTGGVAIPAVFMVGAVASIGAKVGLMRWLAPRAA
jgi:hypothetical protein